MMLTVTNLLTPTAENIQAVPLASVDASVGDIMTPSGWGKPSDGKAPQTCVTSFAHHGLSECLEYRNTIL